MYLAWFALTLALATVYGLCIRMVVGRAHSPLLHWSVAAVLSGSFAVVAVLLTYFQVRFPHDAAVAAHAVLLFVCGWLSVRYWVPWHLWDIPAVFLTIVIVTFFFIDPYRLNNLVLVMLSLGIGVGGYFVSRQWLRVFFLLMGVLDAVLVWGTDIPEKLFQPPCAFPISLIGALSVPFLQVSTIDVAFSALALIGIQRHCGIWRSLWFGIACMGTVIAIAFLANFGIHFFLLTPFLVFLAALVIVFLYPYRSAC